MAQPYADVIGQKYRVIGETVHAYGVFESLDERMLSYVVLMPTPSLSGPEIAFERIVPAGQVITVVGAWRRSRLFDDGIYHVVTLEKSDLPQHVPIRLELSQGNEGSGAELNAAVYEKLPRRN